MQNSGDHGGGTGLIVTALPPTYRICEIPQDNNHNAHLNTQPLSADDVSNMEKDKKAIYRHPLFPLMALLFEKCEQASQTPDCPTSEGFDEDIQAFVQHQQTDKKAMFVDDPELDGLMIKAIQVLRIHLLELEKVSDLCKDFCTRYITCLKGKLQSEQLLRMDNIGVEGEEFMPVGQVQQQQQQQQQTVTSVHGQISPSALLGTPAGQIVSGGTVYQMVQTQQGLVAQPIHLATPHTPTVSPSTPVVHGSTPLSQIGLPNTPTSPLQQHQQQSHTPQQSHSPTVSHSPSSEDDRGGGGKVKRGVLPKQATQVMKSWLFQHIVHPYPTEDEKKVLSQQTGLSILQINNWFINARRRILQPMLDASNPEAAKNKKPKPPQSRPSQRFWPENIASAALQAQGLGDGENESMDDGEEEENSPPPSMVDSKNVPVSAPFMLNANGQLTTLDGQLVHYSSAQVLLPPSEAAVNQTNTTSHTGPVIFSNEASVEVTVSSSDIVSNMIQNVQQAAEKVAQNGEEVQAKVENDER